MIGKVKLIGGVKTVVPLSNETATDSVASGNMETVTSNAVALAINPPSTTIIESTYKRTVGAPQGIDWWSMNGYPAPSVPSGKRLIRTFPRCSDNSVCVALGSIYSTTQNTDIPAIITVTGSSITVQVWLCIEVADL